MGSMTFSVILIQSSKGSQALDHFVVEDEEN